MTTGEKWAKRVRRFHNAYMLLFPICLVLILLVILAQVGMILLFKTHENHESLKSPSFKD
jgi:hypothetical protein